ncbi:hypothetical protein EDB92DRAFT_1863589, partial [Lactarius akahatsu]
GQKTDIANYVRNVVNSYSNTAVWRWRNDNKNIVTETLTERADRMFRWVFCQLETLQHCFPPNRSCTLATDDLDPNHDPIKDCTNANAAALIVQVEYAVWSIFETLYSKVIRITTPSIL